MTAMEAYAIACTQSIILQAEEEKNILTQIENAAYKGKFSITVTSLYELTINHLKEAGYTFDGIYDDSKEITIRWDQFENDDNANYDDEDIEVVDHDDYYD